MIELKTNPDTLHAMATEVMADRIKADVLNAAHDLKNLRDYAEGLERNTHQMSGEIQSIRTQRDEAAAALLAIIRPELQKMIEQELKDATAIDDLSDRITDLDDRLERVEDPADTIRDEVRDMVRDGEIVVSVDLA
jgi:predicted  nucleic acid-binding Zn-ribbon protein